ncbi:MAG: elongation factor G [Pseudomonadota bacterium]
MPNYATQEIRNLAVVGHGGAGKTTLVEALLAHAGAVDSAGTVERGSTVSDFEPEEKSHQHSMFAAVAGFDRNGHHVNLVDTPGYPDFSGRSLAALPAAETALVVVDAKSGVQTTTRRMMEAAAEQGLCRMIVVNRIDTDDVDCEAVLAQIQDAFGTECLPLNLPAAAGAGVADCFFAPDHAASVAFGSVEEAHTQMVDQVVEMDENLMELYLEQGDEMAPEQLHDAFRLALRDGHLIPVCFTSATTGAGVSELADIIERVIPSPVDGNQPRFLSGDGEPVAVTPDPDGHVVAHVFKLALDPFVGRMSVFRVHQGTVTKDSQLTVGDARKPIKIAHLYRLQGKETQEVDAGIPGDICAVTKIDEIHQNAVLHDASESADLSMGSVALPAPMFGLAIQAKSRGDESKISDTLNKLSAEDPTFQVEHTSTTNETVIRGVGELHLRMMLERMKERYNVEVDTRTPKIAYKETIGAPAEGHHRHKKQTGGAGQFGEVYLRVEPMERGGGFAFENAVVGGVIPSQFIPAVEKGVRQVLETGAVAGYPMEDVKVTVYDGKHHSVDSKEIAFVTAAKRAFMDAVGKAKPAVLEPIVNIEVTAPQENMGDIAGDLSSKRGRISGTTALSGGMVSVAGQAPLSELENYQSELKSVTGGAGSYTIELSHYDPVPRPVQQQLESEFNPSTDDD